MIEVWSLVAFSVLALGSGAVTSLICLFIWGYGGTRALQQRVSTLEHETMQNSARITTETKRRAATTPSTRLSNAEIIAASLMEGKKGTEGAAGAPGAAFEELPFSEKVS